MMHVDHETVAMSNLPVPVRMAVRFRALPALVLVLVMLVMRVQMLMLQGPVLVLEQLGIAASSAAGTC
jgi:hypothetical protein